MQNLSTTISLPSQLAEPLRRQAEKQGTEIETLVSDLITQYLRQAEPDKLSNEAAAFQAMHSELLKDYLGRYVAIHEGQVVDDDVDRRALYLRTRSRFGSTPVLIRQVTEAQEREFVVLSPRLERGKR